MLVSMSINPFGAHPRSRGENPAILSPRAAVAGSSPLTRGKPHKRVGMLDSQRLIPAHAGKTASYKTPTGSLRAHPRSRGENATNWSVVIFMNGSSPLTRGKRDAGGWSARRARLIPAHAGKTGLKPPKMSRDTAHPRSRGENETDVSSARHSPGSSPLTRGKPCGRVFHHHDGRLIPAHAGKTSR